MYQEPDNYPRNPQNRARRKNSEYQQYSDFTDEYQESPRNPPRRAANYRRNNSYFRNGYRQKSHKGLIFALIAIGTVAIAGGVYKLWSGSSDAQILAVSPNYIMVPQAYKSCHKVGTTTYVQNQKDGTKGALIGGATGAVAGGIVGNQIHGGGGGTAVGAIVGGATGALIGRDIQRSNQPDYVAKHGTTTKCATAYKSVKKQVGYNVQYAYKDNISNIVVQNQLMVGTKIPYQQLQAMVMPPQ